MDINKSFGNCKCVNFFRMEKWNDCSELYTKEMKTNENLNLFFSMDYFDFCLVYTPASPMELFGRLDENIKNKDIDSILSLFNKNSSSKQVFSLCNGETEIDPFNQEKRYLITTSLSLNSMQLDNFTANSLNDIRNILNSNLNTLVPNGDIFNIYNLMSNEDFFIVVATDNPKKYYAEILTVLRSMENSMGIIFSHSYTIQSYALLYDTKKKTYRFRGEDNFDNTHILRARLSLNYWKKIKKFPVINNSKYKIDKNDNLIGKYNLIFKLDKDEFYKISGCIIEKKLGIFRCTNEDLLPIDILNINDVNDIIKMIKHEGFSYINERSLFSQSDNENMEDESILEFVDNIGKDYALANNNSYLALFNEYKFEIDNLITNLNFSIIDNRNKKNIIALSSRNEVICKNILYRLQRVFECCYSMGRNLYMLPTITYIMKFIKILLKEATDNLIFVVGNDIKESYYVDCFRDGVTAINTLFNICTNKIYDNIQAPNYDIQYTYATEKTMRAYGEILQQLCESFDNVVVSNSNYPLLVIPNAHNQESEMRILFKDSELQRDLMIGKDNIDKVSNAGKSVDRKQKIILINCPFDKQILNPAEMLPSLFHEMGHFFKPKSRTERNLFYLRFLKFFLDNTLKGNIYNFVLREMSVDGKYAFPNKYSDGADKTFIEKIAHVIADSFIDIFKSMVKENSLHIYGNQIQDMYFILMDQNQEQEYNNKFLQCLEQWEEYFNLSNQEIRVKKQFDKLKEKLKSCYEKLFFDSSFIKNDADITYEKTNETIAKLYNELNSESYNKELDDYKECCMEMNDFIEQQTNAKTAELVELIKSEYPKFKFNLEDSGDLKIDQIIEKKQEIISRVEHEYSKINIIFDFCESTNKILESLYYFGHKIINSKTKFDITDEINKICKHWISNMHKKLLEDIAPFWQNYSYVEEQIVLRKIGLCKDNQACDNLELFTKFLNGLVMKQTEDINDIFKTSYYCFREAVADYTMCKICDYTLDKYLKKFNSLLSLKNHDINEYRIALVCLMLINRNPNANDIKSIEGNDFEHIIHYIYLFEQYKIDMELRKNLEYIDVLGKEFIKKHSDIIELIKINEESKCGILNNNLFNGLEFYLTYFYASKTNEGGNKNDKSKRQ